MEVVRREVQQWYLWLFVKILTSLLWFGTTCVVKSEGVKNTEKYQQILLNNTKPFEKCLVNNKFIFEYNNNPKHIAVKNAPRKTVSHQFVPQSPGLDITEAVWDHLGREWIRR